MVLMSGTFKGTKKGPLSIPQKKEVNKIVKKNLKEEIEAHHFEANYSTTATLGINSHISGIGRGDGDTDRNGDRTKIRAISCKMTLQNYITQTTNDNAPNCSFRVMIIQDRSYNVSTTGSGSSAQITLAQLLMNDPVSGAAGINSQRNADHLGTLIALHDKVYTTTYLRNSALHLEIRPNMKYCKRELQWAAGSSATQITNGIFLVVIADQGPLGAATSPPTIAAQTRILFNPD